MDEINMLNPTEVQETVIIDPVIPRKESHVRMMPEDFESLPSVWRPDYIDPKSDISIGDIIAIYTDSVTGVAAYEVGEILKYLYHWCKIGDPTELRSAYEHMYHMAKYLYGAGIGKMVK